EILRVYGEVASRRELTVRAHLFRSPSWGRGDPASITARLDAWQARIAERGTGDAFLRVAGLVAEANPTPDNAVRARAMPYTGWAGFAYDAALPRGALREVLREAAQREIRVASMGTDLLDLYEDVNRVVPQRDRRAGGDPRRNLSHVRGRRKGLARARQAGRPRRALGQPLHVPRGPDQGHHRGPHDRRWPDRSRPGKRAPLTVPGRWGSPTAFSGIC